MSIVRVDDGEIAGPDLVAKRETSLVKAGSTDNDLRCGLLELNGYININSSPLYVLCGGQLVRRMAIYTYTYVCDSCFLAKVRLLGRDNAERMFPLIEP